MKRFAISLLVAIPPLLHAASVTFEAESGALGGDWAASNSSSPAYITITTTGAGGNPASAARVATYDVTFPAAGTYQLYAHVRVGPDTFNDDSMFFANGFGTKSPTLDSDWVVANGLGSAGFSSATDVVTGGGTLGSSVWKWINLSQLTSQPGFTVSEGNPTQTFQIGARENGLDIDTFVFGTAGYAFTVFNLDNGLDGTPPVNACVLNWNDVRQRIDGFGGGVVFLDAGLDPVSTANADTLFSTNNANQLGLTLLRVRIAPNSSWNVNNFSAWSTSLSDGQKAVSRGARVMATPWTPPASMKTNNNTIGGELATNQYASYASYLNTFGKYMASGGVPLAALSLQNEPDANVNYESCFWSAAQFQTFCRNNAGAITSAPVMMPESEGFNSSFSDATLNDSVAVSNVAVVGGHLYGASVRDYPLAHNQGKPTWMSEYLINDQTWPSAMSTAQQIHSCLTVGNMSAYIWWKCLGNTNGLVNASGVPQKRGFVLSQFSRFVRPGSFRIGLTNGSQAQITGYKDANGTFSVVAINSGASDITQTFSFTNCVVTNSVTPWMTTSNLSLAVQAPVATTNSSFVYTLPALSVITFTGQISNGPPVINSISIASGRASVSVSGPVNYDYTLLISTNLVNWQPVLTTNLSALPSILVDTNSATNAMQFYRVRTGM